MILDVSAPAVASSATAETGITAELAATTAATAAALTSVLPMGADLDSAAFAAALNAVGASYLGTAAAQLTSRAAFAGSQALAAAAYTASDVTNDTLLAL